MSMSVGRATSTVSRNKSEGMPPSAVPSSNDPKQKVTRLSGLGAGFVIKGIAANNGIVASRLSVEIGAGNVVSVPLRKGETPLQSAKALKAALEAHSRGGLSAKITRESSGAVKFQAIRRHIAPNA
jgi:hypothetical protein